jgi:hypothetical protein
MTESESKHVAIPLYGEVKRVSKVVSFVSGVIRLPDELIETSNMERYIW